MQSLLHHNTFGIDQSCWRIYEPETVDQLLAVLPELRKAPLLTIGGGSNLLLTKDFEGNVLHPVMKGIAEVEGEEEGIVLLRCGAGEVWDDVVEYAVDHELYGIENLSIIPGEVGASAVQNIGAYGVEVKDCIHGIEAVEIATGRMVQIKPEECEYGYRYSRFKGEWKGRYVITYVTYRLSRVFTPHLDYGNVRGMLEAKGIETVTAADVRKVIIDMRNSKLPDPEVEGNAGSFFMNPVVSREKFESLLVEYPDMPHYKVSDAEEKIPAGWMIEQCGWKGRTLGKAGVHDRQALVLVNKGGATGQDIVRLCNQIRQDVMERFGISINPEVNII